ncbi:hypothetical protein L211DRAFT_834177 [Terfezia boudieri ATCC MYA-4762]|uniref:Uncharacterized protein n=1 Tax=Terfezia boudieri ATCC MYA-4762 TaxID=1051890 RepID=A0A3N4LWQ8_9PEZI|nr:hypothetical protein L211DRAFT_834177 [Terfezia boudieri ATCC MYA-4762]
MKFLTLTLLAATFSLTTATPTPNSKSEVGKASVEGVTPASNDVFPHQFCGIRHGKAWYCEHPNFSYCCWTFSPPICCPRPGFISCGIVSDEPTCFY